MTTLSLILFFIIIGLIIVLCYKQAQVLWYKRNYQETAQKYNNIVNNYDEFTYD